MWSFELDTATSRYLADTHPSRPAGATKIMDKINDFGPLWTPGDSAANPAGNAAFRGRNNGVSTQLLTGAGGPYAGHYDPVARRYWTLNGTTGSSDASLTAVAYDSDRDEFRHWRASEESTSTAYVASSLFPGWGGPHNFGQSCLDPVGRKLYRLLNRFEYDTGLGDPVGDYRLGWMSIDDPTQRGMSDVWVPAAGNYPPIEFVPFWGEQGSVVVCLFGADTTPNWRRFDIATQTWIQDINLTVSVPNMPAVTVCNGALYVVGHSAGSVNRFIRVNADKTMTLVTPPPVLMNGRALPSTDWYHVEFAALGTKIYAFYPGDPNVVDNFGTVYCFDTLANGGLGSWTVVDTMVQKQLPYLSENTSSGLYVAFSVAPMPELGCVFYAQAVSLTGGDSGVDVALIWKP